MYSCAVCNALGNAIVGALQVTPAEQPQRNQRKETSGRFGLQVNGTSLNGFAPGVSTGPITSVTLPDGSSSENETLQSVSTARANADVAILNATQAVQLDPVTVTGEREQLGLFSRLVSDVESSVETIAKYAVGGVELLASGVYNEVVRIVGGAVSVPIAVFGGVDAAVAVQEGFGDTLGYRPQSAGAQSIERGLQPVGQFIDQYALTPAQDFLERNLGDTATTVIVGTAQAGLEIFGVVSGVGAARSAAERLLARGAEGAAVGGRLVIPGQVAATAGLEQEAIVSRYLRDQFGDGNVGDRVYLRATYADGSSERFIADSLVRLPDGSFQVNEAKLSFTKNLTTTDLNDTLTARQKFAFPGIADGSATITIANSRAGEIFFGDAFQLGRTINVRPQINIFVNTPQGQVLRPYP